MQNPRLATRYAKSLLDIAVEKNSLEAVLKDMQLLNHVCAISSDFTLMLRSPIIHGDKKLQITEAVMKGNNMSELTTAFIKLLVAKGREANLPEVAGAFITQYNELKGIRIVKLTTAIPIAEDLTNSIKTKISGFMANDTVDLKTAVDANLIGGFVLEVEDKLFDASVKRSLNDIRAKVMDTSYVAKM